MPTNLPSRTFSQKARSTISLQQRLLAGYVASLAALCALLIAYGPHMRAAAEAEEARVIAEENEGQAWHWGRNGPLP
jgi:hypothetical protein